MLIGAWTPLSDGVGGEVEGEQDDPGELDGDDAREQLALVNGELAYVALVEERRAAPDRACERDGE
jgi:hypothetical protein